MGWDKAAGGGHHEIEIDESALEEEIELDSAREGIDWIKRRNGRHLPSVARPLFAQRRSLHERDSKTRTR
jgi:hypothetical protein